jgi:hypothetical protein
LFLLIKTDHLTGAKSPDNPIFATRSSSIKNKDQSDVSFSPDNTKSLESTKQSNASLKISSKSDVYSSKISPPEQLKINPTTKSVDKILSTTESSNTSPEINSESYSDEEKKVMNEILSFKYEIQPKKSSIGHSLISQEVDLTRPTELSTRNKPKSGL